MSTALTGNSAASTYNSLLKTADSAAITGSLKTVCDGLGNDSALSLSSSAAKVTGTLQVTGAVTFDTVVPVTGGGTGSGTAAGALSNLGGAPLASPTFTGVPAAPTAAAATATTQLATTAFVSTAIANVINSAPGALDTLDELAAAFGDDANFAATMTTALATKAAKASNLSDLTNAGTARTNLGLGTMATATASDYVPKAAPVLTADLRMAVAASGDTRSSIEFYRSGDSWSPVTYQQGWTTDAFQGKAVIKTTNAAGTNADRMTLLDGSSGFRLHDYGSGTLSTDGSGNVTASSDARLKDIRGDVKQGLAAILAITPKLFNWKAGSGLNPDKLNAGFIAQDVQAAIPEAVDAAPDGMLSLSDRAILAVLVNAVKELNAKLEAK